jgi:O-antigen/teichoic acid export membrane protein
VTLKRNLTANYLGQAWVSLMGLIFLPIYIKYLGTEALGLIGVFTLLQTWLTLLDLGITPTLNREMARYAAGGHSPKSIAELMRSLEVLGGIVALAIAATLWVAADYMARRWLQAESLPVEVVRDSLRVMGVVIALRFLEGIFRGALLGLQRHVFYNAVNAVMATVRSAGAVAVVAFISPTVRAFYFWQAIVSVIVVGALATAVHHALLHTREHARVSRHALSGVRQFAGGMLVLTCLGLLVSQVDKILLLRLLPLEQFGYYTLAATIAGLVTTAVAPILQSVYPRLVVLATIGDEPALARTYHQWAQLVTVTTLPLMIVLTLFPEGVVYVWSGNGELASQTAPLLTPLALGTFLNALMWMPYQSQLAHAWTSLTIRVNIVAVVVMVPAILWLAPRYGPRAAGWLWVMLNMAYVLIAVHFMHRRILRGEKRRWYRDDVAAPAAAGALVALVLWLAAPAPTGSRVLWVTFLAAVAAAVAVAATLSADSLRPRAAMLLRRLATS